MLGTKRWLKPNLYHKPSAACTAKATRNKLERPSSDSPSWRPGRRLRSHCSAVLHTSAACCLTTQAKNRKTHSSRPSLTRHYGQSKLRVFPNAGNHSLQDLTSVLFGGSRPIHYLHAYAKTYANLRGLRGVPTRAQVSFQVPTRMPTRANVEFKR